MSPRPRFAYIRIAPLPPRYRASTATRCLGVLLAAACMGQSCGTVAVPPANPPSDDPLPILQPKKPAVPGSGEDLPYDESEFPVDSPADFRNPRTLTVTSSTLAGRAPLLVAFAAGTIEGGRVPGGLVWDFGDGAAGAGIRVQHTYTKAGIYTVGLCAGPSTPGGEDVTCVEAVITVSATSSDAPENDPVNPEPAPPQQLRMTASRWTGPAPLAVVFTAGTVDGDAAPADLVWDFGDGTSAAGQQVTHTYAAPGEYTVRLCAGADGTETLECAEGVVQIH